MTEADVMEFEFLKAKHARFLIGLKNEEAKSENEAPTLKYFDIVKTMQRIEDRMAEILAIARESE